MTDGRSTAQRFGTLDAMRGLAALVVVVFHSGGLDGFPCDHGVPCQPRFGFLAVDLFFGLSGFVLSHAYGERLARGEPAGTFLHRRFLRLFPLYWIAIALGLVLPLHEMLLGEFGVGRVLVATATNAAMLPSPLGLPKPDTFPLDSPAWSLFFEFWVANLVFAVGWRALRGWRLWTLVALSLAALVGAQAVWGSINTGWGWANIAGGVPRVLFGFFMGVAVHRCWRARPPLRTPAPLLLGLVAASFAVPLAADAGRAFEIAVVALVYPAAIYLGASAAERRPALGARLGELSYALYLVHYPLLLVFLRLRDRYALPPGAALEAAYLALSLFAAWLLATQVDARARRLLSVAMARWHGRARLRAGPRQAPAE